jgi:hypothetical protein
MSTRNLDPRPLAPGKAPANYELAFARQKASWKVPLDQSQYDLIRGIFSRVTEP